ncbi:TOBE domain-containing protein [Moellerella wisconsensis]|uniref:TOBE domain-containing protein n=1 Tax=Moellerella wisconsensis TaxID=158849 RepID=A0A9Q8Q2C3_9GAMM|nr:TOBE domain-containing protein [Moellerella wisconsensis]KLN97083.1 transporter [Moellerella wisconsensis]UNH24178.1 TOBE domain-containing protein [Moellerella wisconsensis]UNH27261.1 TOBE domain-containing protein [Moellerella wisconsensis]UNH30736.1 TOBE domain-containing protein [Moellerella wisconsensis]UNH42416.1 TOBE domain-containing protein [Moellerella wisconsensis]
MQISARNQLTGSVSGIKLGSVNNEIVLTLGEGEQLTTVITQESCKTLGLSVGKTAIAIIKAPWVVLAKPDCGLIFSARNQFNGKVTNVIEGAVNSTIHLVTDKGMELTAIITNESLQEMQLTKGVDIIALIKASSVMLATEK